MGFLSQPSCLTLRLHQDEQVTCGLLLRMFVCVRVVFINWIIISTHACCCWFNNDHHAYCCMYTADNRSSPNLPPVALIDRPISLPPQPLTTNHCHTTTRHHHYNTTPTAARGAINNRIVPHTLSHRALDVAHNLTVSIVKKLDTHLCNLCSKKRQETMMMELLLHMLPPSLPLTTPHLATGTSTAHYTHNLCNLAC